MTPIFQARDTFSKAHHFWYPFVNLCDVLMFPYVDPFFCRGFSLLDRCLQIFWLHRSTLNELSPTGCLSRRKREDSRQTQREQNSPLNFALLGAKSHSGEAGKTTMLFWWTLNFLPTKHPDLYKWWSHLGDDASFWNPTEVTLLAINVSTMTLTSWKVWIIIPTRKWWSYLDDPSIISLFPKVLKVQIVAIPSWWQPELSVRTLELYHRWAQKTS